MNHPVLSLRHSRHRYVYAAARIAAVACLLVPGYGAAQTATVQVKQEDASSPHRQLSTENKPWKGDFDRMIERRMIRVLVPYSRTLFYIDKGRERGLTAENVRDFERFINKKYHKQLGKRPITIYIIPTTRDNLFEDVANGLGDIAAGNITVTEERLKVVDFAAPADQKPVSELVVTRDNAPIASVDELAGRTVHVRKASSYYSSLEKLNERFKKEGKAAVKLVLVPDELEDEDMMEMLSAGLMEAIVVDDWKAKMWMQVLPNLAVNEAAKVRDSGMRGWAIRKDSPKLHAELERFYKEHLKGQGVLAYRMKQTMARVKRLKNNATDAEMKKFEDTIALFRKYGEKYGFDPLMLAAQGYQESQLDQDAKSHVGAVGVMQVMPATGAELNVGNIKVIEPNIHAGTKYMDQLLTRYFKDAQFTPEVRPLFAFASYNAGPGNISRMRKEAQKRGLNPDKWFNNVELVTAEKIGIETTTYVRNIYKYYVSYKLILDSMEAQRKAREQVTSEKK